MVRSIRRRAPIIRIIETRARGAPGVISRGSFAFEVRCRTCACTCHFDGRQDLPCAEGR